TKDLLYADLDTIERLTRKKARSTPMPDPIKRYRSARVTRLPPLCAAGEFVDVLLARRTWRRFGGGALDIGAFGTLLALTAGVRWWVTGSHGQKVALKTSP